MKPQGKVSAVSQRMPDGKVFLTVPEAASLWRFVGSPSMSDQAYRRRCKDGRIAALGIIISTGPRFLTDLDSLLEYWDRELTKMRVKLDDLLQLRQGEKEDRERGIERLEAILRLGQDGGGEDAE